MEKELRFIRSGLRRCGWAALLMLLIIQACVPKKHLVSRDVPGAWVEADAAERQQFFDRLTHYQVDFHSINARAKGFLTINDQENHEVNVQLRMRDGEAIWASITSFLGMEVGRLLLTPDSIRVINRIDKKFLVRHYRTLHDLVGQDISFAQLQQLLIGNIPDTAKALKLRLGLFTEGGVLKDNQSDWGDLSVATELHFNHNFRLVTFRSTQNPSSQHQYTSTRGGSVLEATHTYPSGQSEVEQAVQRDHPGFPNKTSIAVQGPRLKLIATLDYNRVILDQPVEMPFNIPKGYSQIH